MAVITRQDIERRDIEALARQSCLNLDAGEIEQGRQYLETIIDLLESLRTVDVSTTPPFVAADLIAALHDPPGPTTLREDVPTAVEPS